MATRSWRHLRTHFVGYLALTLALGGSALAADGGINGSAVKKNSQPGNRVKKNILPGTA